MKRFWESADVRSAESERWAVQLDGRPVKTPARNALILPAQALAEAIAAEWNAVGETVEPRSMPLTGLANAAIDQVAPDPQVFAAGLARYAEGDLACYRAEGPRALIKRQAESWEALLAWGRRRYDVDFVTTSGLMHVAQPQPTVDRLTHAVRALDPFRLTGLSPLVTIGGSLLAGLAVLQGALTVEQAWETVSIDDHWQLEQWGEDAEAVTALENRRADFEAAARFLDLLD